MASRFLTPVFQALDANGKSIAGAQLDFFVVGGSSTRKDTFSDEALTIENSNPVVADGSGFFPNIYGDSQYRVALKHASTGSFKNVQLWARDNVNLDFLTDDDLDINGGTVLTVGGTEAVFNYPTLNDAVISTTLVDGQVLNIAERTAGNGGGAIWDVVLSSTVTENIFSIVQATGVGTLSLELRDNGVNNVKQLGAVGFDATDDDVLPIQFAIDAGGSTFFPPGKYGIGSNLQIRTNNFQSLFGPEGSRPTVEITTLSTFSDRSMIRNWDESWYTEGETDRDVPPADLTAFSDDVLRYVNIHHILFRVNSDLGGTVTAIDLVAQQESSHLSNLVFTGTATTKGYPIRGRSTSTGTEISFNGWKINDIVVYTSGWVGEFFVDGSGSDVDIDTWVTSNADHSASPFFIDVIDFTARNLHVEAHSTGNPVFDLQGTDARIIDSFVIPQDLSGDIFQITNPFGAGFGRTGCQIIGLKINPVGGSWSNVTNASTMNLYNDTSLAVDTVVPIEWDDQGTIRRPSFVYELNPTKYIFVDGNTGVLVNEVLGGATKELFIRDSGTLLAASTFDFQWDELIGEAFVTCNFSGGTAFESTGNDYFNNPQSGRMTFYTSFNGSETRERSSIYYDQSPNIISIASWDSATGTVTLDIDFEITDLRLALTSNTVS